MKRVFNKLMVEFSGKKCTMLDVSLDDLPLDIDFTGYKVNVCNVLYNNQMGNSLPCFIKIYPIECENDFYGNCIRIKVPFIIQYFLYQAHKGGLEEAIELLNKLNREQQMIYNNIKIPYNNTVA